MRAAMRYAMLIDNTILLLMFLGVGYVIVVTQQELKSFHSLQWLALIYKDLKNEAMRYNAQKI